MINAFALLASFILMFIPAASLTFAALRKTGANFSDKLLLSFAMSLIAVPLALFLEYFLIGLKFDTTMILANVVLLTILGIAAYAIQGDAMAAVKNKIKEIKTFNPKTLPKNAPIIVVALIAIASFLIKIIPLSTSFFEFDPYYYNMLTEFLIRFGQVPHTLDISYFPVGEIFRTHPLVQYLTGSWTLLHQLFSGTAFDKGTLILISNIYPPVVGAMLSIVAYWLLKEQYDETAGVIGAVFMAFTPQIIQKFASGVSELQPWGVYSAFAMFALYVLATKRQSYRFALIGGVVTAAALLGGQQYIWPFAVFAGYFLLSTIIDFLTEKLTEKKIIINAIFALSGLLAGAILGAYEPTIGFPIVSILFALSLIPSVILFALNKLPQVKAMGKTKFLGVLVLIFLVFSLLPILPGGTSPFGLFSNYAKIAKNGAPLSNTIAEENPTFEGVFASAFGVLNPYVLFNGLALAFALWAVHAFTSRKEYKNAAGYAILCILLSLFASQVASLLSASLSVGMESFTQSPVFAPFIISIISILLVAALNLKDNDSVHYQLLSVLIIFPVAFIGLNKIKFILHLAIVLAFALPVLLAELARVLEKIGSEVKLFKHTTNSTHVTTFVIAFTLLLGGLAGIVQATGATGAFNGALTTANGLKQSTISKDWLLAMQWLKNNTSYLNPETESNCQAKFGHSCRVMSWWDYGHWTMFLGETKTVLDPTNSRAYFDHQVAHGFVDDANDLKYAMDYHQATHVLVDFELIQKWGALVYLSGTCQKGPVDYIPIELPACPNQPSIQDWQKGAGSSEYELFHYFETINLVNQQCPFAQGLTLAQSSFGLSYCLNQNQIIPIDNSGLRSDLARDFSIISLQSQNKTVVDANMSYLLPVSQQSLINANPDFRLVNKSSAILDSAYVRLYFFNNLPGYKLVYTSPTGEVKIFEYQKP